jgi:hypothetical protein
MSGHMYFTQPDKKRIISGSTAKITVTGIGMLSSPIIDLALGLTFVFGVTAAFASLVTELISRLIGLRGAYLLSGLRELVDGGDAVNLSNMAQDYQTMRHLVQPDSKPEAKGPTAQPSDAEPSSTQPPPAQPSDAQLSDAPPSDAPPSDAPPSDAPPSDTPPPAGRPPGRQLSKADLPSITSALLGGPILGNQGVAGQLSSRSLKLDQTRGTGRLPKIKAVPKAKDSSDQKTKGRSSQLRSLPSYISSRSFAEAVVDLMAADGQGQTQMTAIADYLQVLPAGMPFKESLEAFVKDANGDLSRFGVSVEKWYDDHMDRVSGWYKRYVAKITLAFGVVIVILLNLNALTIGRTLYTENAVSSAISAVAAKATTCSGANTDCLTNLEGQLSAAAAAGLPVGWGTVRACREPGAQCNWLDQRGIFSPYGSSGWQLVIVLVGFVIMIMSLVPGAQFWFGLLTKLGTLRDTGPKPAGAG